MTTRVSSPHNAEAVLGLVRHHSEPLKELGVISLDLFGSVARNEASLESDVDFLVELKQEAGFFEFFQIKRYLEELLNCPVDLGTRDSLREHLRTVVSEDAINVF